MTAPRTDPEDAANPVDLTNCDREPIHLISAIQSGGFLIAISTDWLISRVSANAATFLGRSAEALLGASFRDLITAEAVHTLRNRLAILKGKDAVERAFGLQLLPDGDVFDVAVHMANGEVVIEAELSEPPGDLNPAAMVRTMLGRLNQLTQLNDLVREAARQVRALTGHDRVMIYRFHADGSGEVIAERLRGNLKPYLGLRYPASDIPKQARALMERNIVRVCADVDAVPVPIVPQLGTTGSPLDLSMSTLRSHSPIHLEYLRNMGVRATLTISLLRNGRLWGLIACHHMAARPVSYERRTTAELFAQVLSLLIETRERELVADYEQRARQLHDRLMAAIVERGSTASNLASMADQIAEILPCDGIAVRVASDITLTGTTPSQEQVVELTHFLDQGAASQVFATSNLAQAFPAASQYADKAAGILVIPISRAPRDYLIFFRHEVAQVVNWAGDPAKPVEVGPNGVRLTPRKSFEAWREIVRGQCSPWTDPQLRAADSLRVTLLEVVLRLTGMADTERDASARRQDLLIAELNHRVRNILGLIRGLISQSKAGAADVESFATTIGGRVQALARAHDQITEGNSGPRPLKRLILTEAAAYLNGNAHRLQTDGPGVLLLPEAFATMALVFHEMVTNAAKYGALSDRMGRVNITWMVEPNGDLTVHWQETGGPPVKAPTRRGFGTTIIDRAIPHDLNGESHVDFTELGISARFLIPGTFVQAGDIELPVATEPFGPIDFRLQGLVLLVEDSMIIAMDAEEMLLALGATRVETANDVQAAVRLLNIEMPSFAVLDINLGDETSFPVADRLQVAGISYVFASGYGDELELPVNHRHAVVVKKPYTAESIANAAARSSSLKGHPKA